MKGLASPGSPSSDCGSALSQALRYRFKDPALLAEALTHCSSGPRNNERLELLGDAVVGLIIGELLYRLFPLADEGRLTRLRATLVKRESLARLARHIDLGSHLDLGEGTYRSGGRERDSILAGAFEAVIGALYLDAGMEGCRERVRALFQPLLDGIDADSRDKDPKSRLQEVLQGRHLPLPHYEVIATHGRHHEPVFRVSCTTPALPEPVIAEGTSRRRAEQAAAEQVLLRLRDPCLA
ncbi:MAG: ribonuclease III [Gammaproteobacteria bacterium]